MTKKIGLFLGLFAMIGLAISTGVSEFKVDSMTFRLASDYVNISSNADLMKFKGSGTADDPYIIDGLNLNNHIGNGIVIRNTDAYILIKNCTMANLTGNYYGLYDVNGINIDDAKNVRVENCRLSGSGSSLSVSSAENIQITNYRGKNIMFNGVKNGLIENCNSEHILVQEKIELMSSPRVTTDFMPETSVPSQNCLIKDCKSAYEIVLLSPKNCIVENCYVKDGWLMAFTPINTSFINSTVVNATMEMDFSSNTTLENMTLVDLKGINLGGFSPESYSPVVKNSTANGEKIYYYHDQKGLHLENLTAGYIWLVDCPETRIEGVEAGGIFAINSNSSTIEGSKANQIILAFSKDVLITNNTLRGSSAREAIKLDTGTSNITLYHNIITKSERYFGENLFASGIDASQSDGNNTFENNIITDSGYGIQAGGNNTFTGNTIANNIVSIKVSGNNNRVTQNNFIYNGVDAEQSSYMNISFANNIWDGNFWATYKGVEKDKTGLGSTPYVENIPFPRPGEPSPQVQEPVIDKVPSIVPISKT